MKGKNRCNKQLDFFRVRIEQEQYRKAISCMEEEQYDKAIILFEGLPRDYEDVRNISGNKGEINESKLHDYTRSSVGIRFIISEYIYGKTFP